MWQDANDSPTYPVDRRQRNHTRFQASATWWYSRIPFGTPYHHVFTSSIDEYCRELNGFRFARVFARNLLGGAIFVQDVRAVFVVVAYAGFIVLMVYYDHSGCDSEGRDNY